MLSSASYPALKPFAIVTLLFLIDTWLLSCSFPYIVSDLSSTVKSSYVNFCDAAFFQLLALVSYPYPVGFTVIDAALFPRTVTCAGTDAEILSIPYTTVIGIVAVAWYIV